MPIGPELKDTLERAVSAIMDGVKRIEYTTPYWEITAYRVITSIRVDIKELKRHE